MPARSQPASAARSRRPSPWIPRPGRRGPPGQCLQHGIAFAFCVVRGDALQHPTQGARCLEPVIARIEVVRVEQFPHAPVQVVGDPVVRHLRRGFRARRLRRFALVGEDAVFGEQATPAGVVGHLEAYLVPVPCEGAGAGERATPETVIRFAGSVALVGLGRRQRRPFGHGQHQWHAVAGDQPSGGVEFAFAGPGQRFGHRHRPAWRAAVRHRAAHRLRVGTGLGGFAARGFGSGGVGP